MSPQRAPRLHDARALAAAGLAINAVWALSYPVSKGVLASLPAEGLTAWRLVLSSAVLVPLLRRGDIPRDRRPSDYALLFVMGVIGCALATALQYAGTDRTLAANVSLIVATEPPVVALLGALLLGEAVGRGTVAGAAIAFAGVALVSVDFGSVSLGEPRTLAGNGLVAASVACYAAYTIAGRALARRWGPTALTVLPLLIAAALWIPVFRVCAPDRFAASLQPAPGTWGPMLFLSVIATSLSYWTWNWLAARLEVRALAATLYFQPVFGGLFASLLFGERLASSYWPGVALVLLGTWLSAQRRSSRSNERSYQ